jgi:hypothetical protein
VAGSCARLKVDVPDGTGPSCHATARCHAPERVGAPGRGRQRQAPRVRRRARRAPARLGKERVWLPSRIGGRPWAGSCLDDDTSFHKSFHTCRLVQPDLDQPHGEKGVLCAIGAIKLRTGTDMNFVHQGYPALSEQRTSRRIAAKVISVALVFFPQPPSQRGYDLALR